MPLMLEFCKSYQLRGPKQRPQPDPDTGEPVHSTLLTIDDADRRPAVQPGLAERLDRGHRGAARGDHVLDETDAFAVLEHTLEAVAGPVLLGLLADDQEGQARGERGGSRERYGAQLRPREPDGLGLELSHGASDPLPQRAEQVRPGLEAILVEVVAGAPARAEHEIPLEVGVLAQRGAELGVCQWLGRCHFWMAGVREASQGRTQGVFVLEKYGRDRGRCLAPLIARQAPEDGAGRATNSA